MAQEETKEPAGAKQEAEKPAEAKKPLVPPIVVKISVLGGLLGVVAVGVLFLVTEVVAPMLGSSDPAPVEATSSQASSGERGDHWGSKSKDKGAADRVVTLDDIVVNPAGTGGRRYIKVDVALELGEHGDVEWVQSRSYQMKDLIIRELTARTVDELTDPVAKEEMRESMIFELNRLLDENTVTNLLFTEYVIQ